MLRLFLFILTFLFAGCASVSSIPFSSVGEGSKGLSPVPAQQVTVLRKTKPAYPYHEIGLVTVQGDGPDMEKIYSLVREEAGKRGANGVVDLKMSVRQESIPITSTACDGKGACQVSTTISVRYLYTVSGTMVRRSR